MAEATAEIRNTQNVEGNVIANCPVLCDGTWQKGSFSLQNECVALISTDTGKVLDALDAEAMSKAFKQCQLHSNLNMDNVEYQFCTSSAPAMEAERTERIFRQSVETDKLWYSLANSLADGIEVTKQVCTGHVQNRVGTALRTLKKENHGLGRKGKLTDALIDKMQNYYGIAIRTNVGDLQGMKKGVLAGLFHCASNQSSP